MTYMYHEYSAPNPKPLL